MDGLLLLSLHASIFKYFTVAESMDDPSEMITVKGAKMYPSADLLQTYGLNEYVGRYISFDDVMKIVPEICLSQPHMYLKRLLMANYLARDRYVPKINITVNSNSEQMVPLDSSQDDSKACNPVDYFMLMYSCCDASLQLLLIKCLFECRLAIPILIRKNTFNSWEIVLSPLMNLYITWKNQTGETRSKYGPNVPNHVVAFCRLGALTMSKSNLLNRLLDDQCHPVFSHFEAKNGCYLKTISQGIIEGFWYIPDTVDVGPSFVEPTVFLNLRGDAMEVKDQRELLLDYAHTTVVLTTITPLIQSIKDGVFSRNADKDNALIIVLSYDSALSTNDKQILEEFGVSQKDLRGQFNLHHLKEHENMTKYSSVLYQTIYKSLQNRPTKPLSLLANKERHPFEISPTYSTLKEKARRLTNQIDQTHQNVKCFHTPMTALHWRNTSRSKRMSYFKSTELILSDSLTEFVDTVNEFLSDGDMNEVKMYLKQVEISLNENRTTIIRPLHSAYLKLLKEDHMKDQSDAKIQTKIKYLKEEIDALSFGLENIFRECAVVYEISKECQRQLPRIGTLPIIAAHLLLSGYPIELLDGDVSIVPMRWIETIFTHIETLIKEKHVFVISILGIQSSGKSSLLNILFGLQFSVSAARCTRGIYMQMLPVDRKNSKLGYDYVLVLDTEGVRAWERGHESNLFDNELTTLAIALADLTLVNIKGENYAYMKDILQIAIIALLRMSHFTAKSIKKKRCIFLLQNAPARDAIDKNYESIMHLKSVLDEMTVEAAEQENQTDYHSFTELINFDMVNDIWYFPDMLSGVPPKSHINPEYSKQVSALRKYIFSAKSERCMTILQVGERIRDIWSSIVRSTFSLDIIFNTMSKRKVLWSIMYQNLELDQFQNKQYTIQDIVKVGGQEIGSKTGDPTVKCLRNVIMWLKRILMCDYKARDRYVPVKGSTFAVNTQTEADLFSDDDDNEEMHNPVDYFLLVFSCCDDILKSLVVKNLFLCRLAIPILLPNYAPHKPSYEFRMSSLRGSQIQMFGDDRLFKECFVPTALSQSVAFMRFGHLKMSKSNLLNRILSYENHPIFSHFEAENGSQAKMISQGMIEGSWFVPGKKESELKFEKLTLFLNLRGNGLEEIRQVQYLKQHADVIVVLTDTPSLCTAVANNAFSRLSNEKGLIVVVDYDKTKDPNDNISKLRDEEKVRRTHFKLMDAQSGTYTTKLVQNLQESMRRALHNKPLKTFQSQTKTRLFSIDSTDLTVYEAAAKLVEELGGQDGVALKEAHTPIGWKFWRNGTRKERETVLALKEFSKTATEAKDSDDDTKDESGGPEDNTASTTTKHVLRPSTAMGRFIKALDHYLNQGEITSMIKYLKYVEIDLIAKSLEAMSSLRSSYIELCRKGHTPQGRTDKALQKDIRLTGEKMVRNTFSLEHILRELALMYEYSNDANSNVAQHLPMVAVKLLLNGLPIELLDGDASNIPLKWVDAVFSELHREVGDKKIFILSILGIQSSGKSTLLNTMFGAQFSVSAARCTRGVFIQLVPVDREASGLEFDYILILDTEGLRAPERGEQSTEFDNELAALVIGLGDVTLINIKGENYSEMKEVLQISIFAFLRMNLVSEFFATNRRCFFIHQNVPALDAEEKTVFACSKLVESLNEMTKLAATKENMPSYTTFSEIISFDSKVDVLYLPDRWTGESTMQHVNPAYSDKVAEVRHRIFSKVQKSKINLLPVNEISARIRGLWMSISKEDFVFSFRNYLQVRSYYELEKIYNKLMVSLDQTISKTEKEYRKLIAHCSTEEDLSSQQKGIEDTLLAKHKSLEGDIVINLKAFCSEEDFYIGLMANYKQQKEEVLFRELKIKIDIAKSSLFMLIESRKIDIDMNKQEVEDTILELAIETANKHKGRAMDVTAKEQLFEKKWLTWQRNVPENITTTEPTEIKKNMETILNDSFTTHKYYLYEALKKTSFNDSEVPLEIQQDIIQQGHLSIQKNGKPCVIAQKDWDGCQEQVAAFINGTILSGIVAFIALMGDNYPYNTTVVSMLVRKIQDCQTDVIEIEDGSAFVQLRHSLIAILAVSACRYAYPIICRCHKEYLSQNNREKLLEQFKSKLWIVFEGRLQDASSEIILANLVSDNLKNAILKFVRFKIQSALSEWVTKHIQTKDICMRQMLERMGSSFELKKFITDPMGYAAVWLQSKIIEEEIQNIVYNLVDSFVTHLSSCVDKSVMGKSYDVSVKAWQERFIHECQDLAPVGVIDFQCETVAKEIKDPSHFNTILKEKLEGAKDMLKEESYESTRKTVGCQKVWFEKYVESIWGVYGFVSFLQGAMFIFLYKPSRTV